MSNTAIISKSASVKAVFEEPVRSYLERRRHDITIRSETVSSMMEGFEYHSLLDIGCGDGSISLPLLNQGVRMLLLDFSSSMLSLATSRVPPELEANVEIRNGDFMKEPLLPASYDIVLCLGLLAHVDSPEQFFKRVT